MCTSSCDVSKAKQGVDPHPKIDELQNTAKANPEENAPATGRDTDTGAVILDGSLRATSAAVSPASAAQSAVAASIQAQGQFVNLLI